MEPLQQILDILIANTSIVKNKHKKLYRRVLLSIIIIVGGLMTNMSEQMIIDNIKMLKDIPKGETFYKKFTKFVKFIKTIDIKSIEINEKAKDAAVKLAEELEKMGKSAEIFTENSTKKERMMSMSSTIVAVLSSSLALTMPPAKPQSLKSDKKS